MMRRLSLSALALLAASACDSGEPGYGGNSSGGTMNTNGPSTANNTGSSNGSSAGNTSSNGTTGSGSNDGSNDGDDGGATGGGSTGSTGGTTAGTNGSTGGTTGGTGSTGGSSSGENGPPLGESCGGKVKTNVEGPLPTFVKNELSKVPGAAYMRPVDLDGDKFPEMLLTNLSEGIGGTSTPPLLDGAAHVLKRTGGAPTDKTLGTWAATKVFDQTAKIGFPNESEFFDVDGDKIGDWMIGAGFLTKPTGKIIWMKGKGDGTFGALTSIPVPNEKCWYHSTVPVDIDADGDNDFITSCHVGDITTVNGPSQVEWFENDGKGAFTHHPIGAGGGAIISLYDIDEDGDKDVVAPQFFGPESMIWYEQSGPKGTAWAKHVINTTTGRGFVVRFADMNGDGRTDMVYGNHNNQQAAAPNNVMGVYWFDIPGKDVVRTLANWDAQMHKVHEGFMVPPDLLMNNKDSAGAPGMLNVGDIDGDCDMDITASGDGDQGLYVLVQQKDKFDLVTLFKDASNANSGEQHMLDLDGDGDLDIMWAVFGPAGILAGLALNSHVYAFLQN